MRQVVLFLLWISVLLPVKAFQPDSLRISVLTVMPRPDKVYTVYGHTALRIHYPPQDIDMAYNWGTFDFDSPNFTFRFIKGKTDYFLSTSPYDKFIWVYSLGNAEVIEQHLDLPKEAKEKILFLLMENELPENREYRYNFLFDNCVTRIRDILEISLGESLLYPQKEKKETFRTLIHSCTEPYPWMAFGIDLIIGAGADSLINLREEMFLPLKFKEALDASYVINPEGSRKELVNYSQEVLTTIREEEPSTKFRDTPFIIGIIIFFLLLGLSIAGVLKKRHFRGVFSILFLIAGTAGILISFLVFFSYHPATNPNWNLLWLHPLHFIAAIGYFFNKSYRFISLYHGANLLLLCILLLSWNWLPQVFNIANIPYILSLGLASVFWLITIKKQKR